MAPSERAQAKSLMSELNGVVEGAVRGIGHDVLDQLAAGTPRDTGFTARSWRARSGRPVSGLVGGRSAAGLAKAKSAQEASRAGIASYGLEHGKLFVSNPSPNAGTLNAGTSSKEPSGFIQRAISKALLLARVRRP